MIERALFFARHKFPLFDRVGGRKVSFELLHGSGILTAGKAYMKLIYFMLCKAKNYCHVRIAWQLCRHGC
jgi:hypothetical protein